MADRLAEHLRGNDEQLAQRRELGDSLDIPRDVTHVAIFRRGRHARLAAETLRAHGFSVSIVSGGIRSTVEATRPERLDRDESERFTTFMYDLVTGLGGVYDGWGAEVVRAPYVERVPSGMPRTTAAAVVSFAETPNRLVVHSRNLYRRMQSQDRLAYSRGLTISEVKVYGKPDAPRAELRRIVQDLMVRINTGQPLP
jgi:hypothetical protein